jgi:hypothetical protein
MTRQSKRCFDQKIATETAGKTKKLQAQNNNWINDLVDRSGL